MRGVSQPVDVDVAMLPVDDKELDELELFTTTVAARSAVRKAKQLSKKHRNAPVGG